MQVASTIRHNELPEMMNVQKFYANNRLASGPQYLTSRQSR